MRRLLAPVWSCCALLCACASQPGSEPASHEDPAEREFVHALPAPIVETPPPHVRVDVHWRPGFWSWEEGAWTWNGGRWIREVVLPMPPPRRERRTPRPDGTAMWVPGYWTWWGRTWGWTPGHWEESRD